jgi:hypothetical protein
VSPVRSGRIEQVDERGTLRVASELAAEFAEIAEALEGSDANSACAAVNSGMCFNESN